MKSLIAAIVAVTLLGAAKSQACESLAFVAPGYSQAFVAPVVAPVVYQAQLQAVTVQPVVAAYSTPVVQQVVVRQQVRVRRQPVQRFFARPQRQRVNVQVGNVCY